MITKLSIHNYKGFMNFEMECGRIVFLMGRNGSGKSSLFDVLHLLANVIHDGSLALFHADQRCKFAAEAEMRFEVGAQLRSIEYHYTLSIGFNGKEKAPQVLREELVVNGQVDLLFENGALRFGRESSLIELSGDRGWVASIGSSTLIGGLREFRDWWGQFVHLRLVPSLVTSESKIPAERPEVNGSNFAAWYEKVSNADTEAVVEYWQMLKNVIPDLSAINMVPIHRASCWRSFWARMENEATSSSMSFPRGRLL